MKLLVVFYSKTGNVAKLAEAIAQGAKEIEGAEVILRRVNDLAPTAVIEKSPQWAKAHAELTARYQEPSLDELAAADAIIFGSPTRYGNVSAELKQLIDMTGGLWAKGRLVNKVGSVFTSASTPHGGHETTSFTMLAPLIHLGMIIVAPGYTDPIFFEAGAPYGATSVSGGNSDIPPAEKDLQAARAQGKRVAEIAKVISQAGIIHH